MVNSKIQIYSFDMSIMIFFLIWQAMYLWVETAPMTYNVMEVPIRLDAAVKNVFVQVVIPKFKKPALKVCIENLTRDSQIILGSLHAWCASWTK